MKSIKSFHIHTIAAIFIACGGLLAHLHASASNTASNTASNNNEVKTTSSPSATDPQSKLVATVNGQKITEAEINAITSKSLKGITDPAIITRVKSQALNELINEYLAAAALQSDPISQNPEAVQQLERIKRQVMMNFYLSNAVETKAKADPARVNQYLQEHPELTSGRQLFHFNQIAIEASETATLSLIQALVSQDPSLVALQTWLKDNKVPNGQNNLWKSTDQLNPALLTTLNRLKGEKEKGVVNVTQSQDKKGIVVLKLYDAYPDPVTLDAARTTLTANIEQSMRSQLASEILAGLRTKGNVQILDQDFVLTNANPVVNNNPISTDSRNRFLTYALVMWTFSLLVLVPFALIVFYRQRIINAVDMDSLPPSIGAAELKDIEASSRLLRRLVLIPTLLAVACFLFMPLYFLLVYPPQGLGLQTTSLLVLAGMLFGAAIVTACFKLPKLQSKMKSGWVGLMTLIAIQFIFFVLGF